MKWKNRLTNYNFWISIVSATLLILQAFNSKLDIANINEIVTALLGLLVVIGIINDPTKSAKETGSRQAKTDMITSTTKQKKGCALAEENDNANQNNNKTESSVDTVLPETDVTENDAQQTESTDVEEQPCPACEEIKNAEQNETDLKQSADNLNSVEQPSSELDNQAFEAILEGEIPSAEQNEADYGLAENDLQILIKQISQDIKDKYAELNKLAEGLNFVADKQKNIDSLDLKATTDNANEPSKEVEQNVNILEESTPINKQIDEPQQADKKSEIFDDEVVKSGQSDADVNTGISQENTTEQTEIPTHFNIVN